MSASCHDLALGASPTAAPPGGPTPRRRPGLTVCGSCAGETLGGGDKARDEQLRVLRDLADKNATPLTVVDCLDACERGDVVVVRPSAAGRAAGVAPVWLQWVAGPGAIADLGAWLAAGGPGEAAEPAGLEPLRIVDPAVSAGSSVPG